MGEGQPRLLDHVRDRIGTRRKHYSIRPSRTYVDWIRRLAHNKRYPRDTRAAEMEAFRPTSPHGGETRVGLDAEPGQ
ncbi:MAG: hypothetical protein ACREA0_23090 [bacterium]